jgi:hypothetical protein
MSQEAGREKMASQPTIRLRKQIVPFEESNPAEEPLFINYSQVAQAGGSFYIDVGVIPLDDIISKAEEAPFLVLNRLVMSKETLSQMAKQIQEMLTAVEVA